MRVLVTGGAGFIGSHIVDALVAAGDDVAVLDDLDTGFRENVNAGARLVIGSVADEDLVRDTMQGCDVVFHQAAHKAVLRSVERPLITDTVNTHGTLTVLKAALDAGVGRVVHASSSSVYGGAATLPTAESEPLNPRSPYAVSKLAAEHYCRVFSELYGLETVALRYFNVYGARQRPDATYAAVIPLFVDALLAAGGRSSTATGSSPGTSPTSATSSTRTSRPPAPAERCAGPRLQHRGRRIVHPARRAADPRRPARRRSRPRVRRAPRRRRAPQPSRRERRRARPRSSGRASASTTASGSPSTGSARFAERIRLIEATDRRLASSPSCSSPPVFRFSNGVRFWSNGRTSVVLFGEVASCLSAWMYVNCRYCGVSWAWLQLVSGFGTTVETFSPSRRIFVATPPHARICCESAVASAWIRVMSACCSAVACSNFCCSWVCCAVTFAFTAALIDDASVTSRIWKSWRSRPRGTSFSFMHLLTSFSTLSHADVAAVTTS